MGKIKFELEKDGTDRYRVFNPFLFDDGDHLVIVLRKEQSNWILSDEGHTYMHFADEIDSDEDQEIITNILSLFNITELHGELISPIQDRSCTYENILSFAQAILKIGQIYG